jgi:hypothetical protein
MRCDEVAVHAARIIFLIFTVRSISDTTLRPRKSLTLIAPREKERRRQKGHRSLSIKQKLPRHELDMRRSYRAGRFGSNTALQRSCAALAVQQGLIPIGTIRQHCSSAFLIPSRLQPRLDAGPASDVRRQQQQQQLQPKVRSVSSSSSSAAIASFQPPSRPPGTHGTPVFPDIDFSEAGRSEHASRRNSDPDAVFAVTGASRGIGLQFVKSLIERTKVDPQQVSQAQVVCSFYNSWSCLTLTAVVL